MHDYADVDLALVWKTVREDLPGLIERLNAILEEGSASWDYRVVALHAEAPRI